MRRTHARHVTAALADDIFTQTGLTPVYRGRVLVVADGHQGEYVLSSRESGLPDGESLMLVHDQCDIGADEPTLLLDFEDLQGDPQSQAWASRRVCAAITERQATIERLMARSRI